MRRIPLARNHRRPYEKRGSQSERGPENENKNTNAQDYETAPDRGRKTSQIRIHPDRSPGVVTSMDEASNQWASRDNALCRMSQHGADIDLGGSIDIVAAGIRISDMGWMAAHTL